MPAGPAADRHLIRTDHANCYTISDVEPLWKRRGMLWSDISSGTPVLKMYTASGWVDIQQYYNGMTRAAASSSATITSTSNTAAGTGYSSTLQASKNILIEVQMISSGTGYGRVGLAIGTTIVNTATTDGGCLLRDDATNRGATGLIYVPRRDTTFIGGTHGTCWAARIGTADAVVRVGLTAAVPTGDQANGITIYGAVSAASTSLWIRYTIYLF